MHDENFKLLPDDYKISVIQALTDARRIDINEFVKEFALESFNGIDFLIWDFINSNLIRNAADERLITIKVKRGRWTLVLLYDTELKYLYTLMKSKRFKQLQDQRKKRSTAHYIDALSLLNSGLYADDDQLCLFENETWDKGVESLLHRIVQGLQNEIERFVVIGFSASKDDITSVSAIVPSPELGVVHKVDWSELIPLNYSSNSVTFDYTPFEEEEEDIPLKLKEQSKTNDDPSVNLKKHDDNVNSEDN